MSILMHVRAVCLQYLPDQQPEFAVSQHSHGLTGWNSDLIENLACRREWLDKHRLLGRDLARHSMQIAYRQRQKLAERAGVFNDPEHGALGAMTP
jgi:hypothetical protein